MTVLKGAGNLVLVFRGKGFIHPFVVGYRISEDEYTLGYYFATIDLALSFFNKQDSVLASVN